MNNQVNSALYYEVNGVAGFIGANDFAVFFKNLFLQEVVDLIQEFMLVSISVKVIYLLQQLDLELLPRVLVCHCMLL